MIVVDPAGWNVSTRIGSWSVVATVRAPAAYIDKFLAHYAALGAERIFMFFDDPTRQAHDRSLGAGRVQSFACGDAYWGGRGMLRPENLEGRQTANAAYALQLNPSEWLLHVDSDELIVSKRPIDQALSGVNDRVFSLVILPLEAVHASVPHEPLSTPYFKRRLPATPKNRLLIRQIFGELAEFSHLGFFGHTAGKSFIRTRYKVERLTVHAAVPADRGLVAGMVERRIELLHFDAAPFDEWREKFLRRISGAVWASGMSKARLSQGREGPSSPLRGNARAFCPHAAACPRIGPSH